MRFLFLGKIVWQMERLGILTLSAVLKGAGHEVAFLNVHAMSPEEYFERIQAYHPEVMAYSVMSNEMGGMLSLNRELKKNLPFPFISLFGGPHATFFPEMIEEDGVDALCRGEGESAILQYIAFLKGDLEAEKVPNFWIKQGKNVVKNAIELWPMNLDDIPFPDRHLWDVVDPVPGQKNFFSSRGCPYQCTYCFNHKYNRLYGNPKKIVRYRSVDNFISEIESVVKDYPKAYPFFDDDSFLMKPIAWMREFTEKYPQRVGKPFGCNIRADQVTEEKIRLLAEAGCHHCWWGVECGDEQYANEIMKRNLSNKQIMKTASLLKKYGIKFVTLIINVLPTDDPISTDEKSLDLCIKLAPDFAFTHIFYPLPGTDLAQYAKDRGLVDFEVLKHHDPLRLLSPLTFPKPLKRQLERQSKLFGVIVAFPALRSLLPFLRKLPLLRVYIWCHLLYNGYCERIKLSPSKKDFRYFASLFMIAIRKLRDSLRQKDPLYSTMSQGD